MKSISKLRGVVQHYNWGGSQFIPDLIGVKNGEQKPFAEYWLGAHPAASATLFGGEEISLHKAIQDSPEQILGKRVQQAFGKLPYLLKILDVQQMLSIQVHPSIGSAKKGFAEENEKGIPVNAPHRNYKDENHKPELMAALSDFWLLHGFKDVAGMTRIFATVPELSGLQNEIAKGGYKGLYEKVMTISQAEINKTLSPLIERILPQYESGELQKKSEHFWAARAVKTFCKDGQYDRGIFSIYFFNLLHLKKGEGIYQPAGLPHAYLEGQNVEVMANSDNVLRAGLTDKHIDVAELMKHVQFEPTIPNVIAAKEAKEQVYTTPADEFELTRFNLGDAAFFTAESAVIFFVYEGKIALTAEEKKSVVKRGEAALITANQPFELKPEEGTATVFAVTVPTSKN